MKKYLIKAFHGTLPRHLEQILDEIATKNKDSYQWEYSGTLDNFESKWPKPFCVYGSVDFIYVTQYNNFGQR